MKQISALERLKGLPDIFRGANITLRFGWDAKQAAHYLYLWRTRGLVAAFGGHSDVYANLVVAPHPDWEKALLEAMPSAVFIGIDALRRYGVTTQITARPEVAVSSAQGIYQTDRFDVSARSPDWFRRVESGIHREGPYSILKPEWALTDLLKTNGGWAKCGLDPDDIEWPGGEPDREEMRVARAALDYFEPRKMMRPSMSM